MRLQRRQVHQRLSINSGSTAPISNDLGVAAAEQEWRVIPTVEHVRSVLMDVHRCLSVFSGSAGSAGEATAEDSTEAKAWSDHIVDAAKKRLVSLVRDTGSSMVDADDSGSPEMKRSQSLTSSSSMLSDIEEVRRWRSDGEEKAKLLMRHVDEDAEQQARSCLLRVQQRNRRMGLPPSPTNLDNFQMPLGSPGSLTGRGFSDTFDSWAWAPMRERQRHVSSSGHVAMRDLATG